MTISTYSELEDAVENWLHRSNLGDRTAEFIVLGEARIGREVRARQMETLIALSPTSNIVSLPSDYQDMRAIRVIGSTIGWLDYLSPDKYFSLIPSDSSSTSKTYTIFGETLVFPSQPTGNIELWYYKKLAALSSAANTLFTRNPDLYLYAALAAAAPFQLSGERLVMFEGLYQNAKDSVNLAAKQGRYATAMSVKVA